jgi:23S rRNA (cytosine1962-C5)-methyltransferase
MYAVGLSAQVGLNVVQSHFKDEKPEFGEFYLYSNQQRHLPMGTFLRFRD